MGILEQWQQQRVGSLDQWRSSSSTTWWSNDEWQGDKWSSRNKQGWEWKKANDDKANDEEQSEEDQQPKKRRIQGKQTLTSKDIDLKTHVMVPDKLHLDKTEIYEMKLPREVVSSSWNDTQGLTGRDPTEICLYEVLQYGKKTPTRCDGWRMQSSHAPNSAKTQTSTI